MQATSIVEQVHVRALEVAGRYRRCEVELIDVLQQVEQHRVFVEKGYSSLFDYAVKALGLSRDRAYGLILVARKSRTIPELKEGLKSGVIHMTNARRVVAVITPENKSEWLLKAADLSERRLEKEIATVMPTTMTPERAKYVSANRVKLELGLSEKAMMDLRRVQDLASKEKPATLEDVIVMMTQEYLKRHDPIQKAKRHIVKKQNRTSKTVWAPKLGAAQIGRQPIPAADLHRLNLRDDRQCTFESLGIRCKQKRWLEIHHIKPVREGGENTLENLTTLCSIHHDWTHRRLE